MIRVNKKFKESSVEYPELDFTLQSSGIKSGGVRLMPGETYEVTGLNVAAVKLDSSGVKKKKKKSGSGAGLAIAAGAGLLILKGMS